MNKLRYLVFVFFVFPLIVMADSKVELQKANSRVAGACEMLLQMMEFQEKEKLQGGDVFIERFLDNLLGEIEENHLSFGVKCAQSWTVHSNSTVEVEP